jgi:hypothetical protein
MAASLNLSRSSPFGSLDEVSNRRTFAYLIATLNASHPDYDFSHVLRPADFKRERVFRRVMTQIDSTLSSVRPNSTLLDVAIPRSSPAKPTDFNTGVSTAPAWGPQMWSMIDKEMMLKDCTVFSYQPADDPFDEEEGAIWALHYFFFNKALKRVCYLYVRGVPVMSQSPRMPAHATLSRRAMTGLAAEMDDEDMEDDDDELGANKRARYWLGDRFAERITASDDDMDDGLVWNRDADGDVNCQYDEDYDEEYEEEEEVVDAEHDRRGSRSSVRGVSEDIAARMEIDV